jgi:hypothetical protein
MPGTFGKKPSNAHVVWTNREGEGRGKKRFDFKYLKLWAANFGVDYETRTRVDHDRAEEPRHQHLVVFEWAKSSQRTIEMGDESWDVGGTETPRTFVEIDEAGDARIKSWKHEAVVDLREMYLDGTVVKIRTADRGKKALDAQNLLRKARDSDS